ncbi:hypothetical protein Ancab_014589 [Ancistrocladus abbreviatus]
MGCYYYIKAFIYTRFVHGFCQIDVGHWQAMGSLDSKMLLRDRQIDSGYCSVGSPLPRCLLWEACMSAYSDGFPLKGIPFLCSNTALFRHPFCFYHPSYQYSLMMVPFMANPPYIDSLKSIAHLEGSVSSFGHIQSMFNASPNTPNSGDQTFLLSHYLLTSS